MAFTNSILIYIISEKKIMTNIQDLNKRFSIEDAANSLKFKAGKGDIPVVEIKSDLASATISLQGAHILSWKPSNERDVIWISNDASYAMGKSIRGGVPLCWPWFGAHENNDAFPAHGFARTVLWQVKDTQVLSFNEIQITFSLDTDTLDENLRTMWPFSTRAEFKITVSDTLKLELTTFNLSDEDITIGQALHTYFNIKDIESTVIHGLDGKTYLDKTDGFVSKQQDGDISIDGEIDRVYLDTADDAIIDDTTRKIVIEKQGSQSTVVWNPGEIVADKMGDLGTDGYRNMLCVESANAANDVVEIGSGKSHSLSVTYKIK